MAKYYEFPCGCRWPVIEENTPEGVLPLMDFDIERAPEDCPAAWGLLGRGECKGVFQLESSLGRTWTKRLKPENAEHITALGALLRPGCLRAVDAEGVSTTQHYVRRKNREESVESYHPAVDPILFPTYNVLAYQEQAMAIAQVVAGFDLQQADQLRKAIGKKLPEEMAKCETMFIEGAKKAGVVTAEMAAELFGWIKESQRYSFNKSHACCYGLTGYDCAYIKAHFPVAFFTAWLLNARHKQDPQQEVFELVNDARLFDIAVEPPDLRSLEPHFHTDRRVVKFGLSNIKGVGVAQIQKLRDGVAAAEAELGKPPKDWSWHEFLFHCSDRLTSSVVVHLIEVGALRWMGVDRSRMSAEFKAWDELTARERDWMKSRASGGQAGCFIAALRDAARVKKEGGACATKNRVSKLLSHADLLEKPATPIVDTPLWLAHCEEELLGISLTCSKVDSCDLSQVNCSCKEYLSGRAGFLVLGVEVQSVREVKTRKGKTPGSKMAFMTVSDATCSLEDVVAFPEAWKEFGGLLVPGNTVIIQGERDTKNKDSNSLMVKRVWQASQSGGVPE